MADVRWRPLRQWIGPQPPGPPDDPRWVPVEGPIMINATTFAQALQGIVTRRVNLENYRALRKRQIDEIQREPGESDDQAAIARVIAFDATFGWPTS